MKKTIYTLISSLTVFLSSSLTALPTRPCLDNPGWFGDVGLEAYYYRYRETIENNQFFMSDTGPMFGLYYALGYQPECTEFRAIFEGRIAASSSIHYKSIGTGTAKNGLYSVVENRLLGTYPIFSRNQFKIEGYVGIGGRFLVNNDSDSVTTTGHYGGYRRNRFAYIPLGLKIVKDICECRIIGHVEYDFFMGGEQMSGPSRYCNRYQQKSGRGGRAGMDLLIPSSFGWFDYNISAFIRYWDINATAWVPYRGGYGFSQEPKNTTYEIGARLGISF